MNVWINRKGLLKILVKIFRVHETIFRVLQYEIMQMKAYINNLTIHFQRKLSRLLEYSNLRSTSPKQLSTDMRKDEQKSFIILCSTMGCIVIRGEEQRLKRICRISNKV
jgi:hypothetical protein